MEEVEYVLDTGSQIVSMAQALAERMGVAWDPDVRIYIQSANGHI
jgi:predicted aspartyl protease